MARRRGPGAASDPRLLSGRLCRAISKIMGYLGRPSEKLNAVRDEEVGLKC